MASSLFKFRWVLIVLAIIKVTKGTPYYKWQKVEEAVPIFIEQEQKFTWIEANDECGVRNLSLITVDTIEKNQVINSLLRKKFHVSPNLWIGGSDLDQEGKFIWTSTGKMFDFTNWQHQQPDNSKNEGHCVHYRINSDFEWNNAPCWRKMGFICEEN